MKRWVFGVCQSHSGFWFMWQIMNHLTCNQMMLIRLIYITVFSLSWLIVLKRLHIAKEFGDKSAERRAHCNLGNAHIFLNQFQVAAGHYKWVHNAFSPLLDRCLITPVGSCVQKQTPAWLFTQSDLDFFRFFQTFRLRNICCCQLVAIYNKPQQPWTFFLWSCWRMDCRSEQIAIIPLVPP